VAFIALAVAIGAAGLLLAGWCLYPLLMAILAGARRTSVVATRPSPATVSVVIATREAPEVVAARVADVVAGDYPRHRLEIVVGVDRDAAFATDRYEHAIAAISGSPDASCRVVRAVPAAGKSAALDAAVRAAHGEIVVFTDSAQRFAPDAIARLVGFLGDTRYGAASGRLATSHDGERGNVLGAFWRYETLLRRLESRVHSIPAVTGAIYALRRELWRTPPHGLICDDLFVPMSVVRAGRRVGYCDEARAFDPRVFTGAQELARRTRTLTGMLQMCAWQPWILAPWRNPIWAQFVCHKLIRIATPLLAVTAAAAVAVALAATGWLAAALAGFLVGATGALAVLELLRPGSAPRVVQRLGMAARLLLSPLVAMGHALRGDWNVWTPIRVDRRVR
jgi:biofilm PGA synthesis N-glycosyltransferase PgaC